MNLLESILPPVPDIFGVALAGLDDCILWVFSLIVALSTVFCRLNADTVCGTALFVCVPDVELLFVGAPLKVSPPLDALGGVKLIYLIL